MGQGFLTATSLSDPGLSPQERKKAVELQHQLSKITFEIGEAFPDSESLVRFELLDGFGVATRHLPIPVLDAALQALNSGTTTPFQGVGGSTALGAGPQSQPPAAPPAQGNISDDTLRIIDGYLAQILDGTTYMRHDKAAIPLILNDASARAELENHIANTHGLGFVPRRELNDATRALEEANAQITQLKADLAAAQQAPPGTFTQKQVEDKIEERDKAWRDANKLHRVEKTEVAVWFEALDGIKGKDSKNLPGLKGKKVLEPAEVRVFDATLKKMKSKLPEEQQQQ